MRSRPTVARLGAALAVLMLAAACAGDVPMAPDQPPAPSLSTIATTSYVLGSRLSPDKCMGVVNGSQTAGARVALITCNGATSQQFTVANSELRVYGGTKCVDAAGGNGRNLDRIIIWTCTGNANQKWTRTSTGQFKGINGKCIDIPASNKTSGTGLILYTCHSGTNQHWDLRSSTSTAPAPAPAAPSGVAPALPSSYVNSDYVAPTGKTITVPSGGNLQAAIDAAVPGDQIVLQSGARYTGNFTLPKKSGSGWITIRSSSMSSLPPAGTRVGPGNAGAMAKIVTPNYEAAIRTRAGAHHYRIMGVEVTAATSAAWSYRLIALGSGGSAQNSLSLVPTHLVLDRVYVHGHATQDLRRCVELNSATSAIVDSYLSGCHSKGNDSQAINGWNGPGPYKIVNNYLEGAGENVMFGGGDPHIQYLVPSDIEFRRNHLYKPMSWKGVWLVKNSFELKNARRVLIEGNVFQNNWVNGQSGFAILFQAMTQENRAPWSTVRDITFRYNRVTNTPHGVNIASRVAYGSDALMPSEPSQRISFTHNVFDQIGTNSALGSGGRLFMIGGDLRYLTLRNNTGFSTSHVTMLTGKPQYGFVMENNVFARASFGVFGDIVGEGTAALTKFTPGYRFRGNVIHGNASASRYPTENFFPQGTSSVGFVSLSGSDYRLSSSSPYKGKGTDGRDPGADIATYQSKTAGVVR